jgi:uncharacterized protein
VQYNVSQLLREPIGSRRPYLLKERFAPPDSGDLQVELTGPVDLLRTDRGILAQATLTSTTHRTCDRCLNPVSLPVRLEIEEEYLPTIDPASGAVLPPLAEPDVQTIDSRHMLDLTEAARQVWLLSEPMQVLCREDCLGLCPDCGQDRNSGACTCDRAPVDSRWAALTAFARLEAGRPNDN